MGAALERSGLLRALLRHRILVLAVAALASAVVEVRTSGPSTDGWYFAAAGRALLSSHGLHIYASPGLQSGPIQLALFGLLALLTGWLHLPDDATYAVVSTLASTALCVAGIRALRRRVGLPDSPAAELLIGSFAIGWLLATEVYRSGHPAELAIPLLWIAAAALSAEQRAVVAGLLIGLGAGFETWAVLGVPVLLLDRTWRGRAAGAVTAGTVAAALYLPFVVAGPFRMGRLHWDVASTSLVHALDPSLADFPWSARLAQAAIVMTLGVLAWAGTRRIENPAAGILLIPAVLAVAKATSEAAGYDWYWLPAQLTLLAVCGCADGMPRRLLAVAVVAEAVAVTSPLQRWQLAVAALTALVIVAWRPAAHRPPSQLRTLRSSA